MALVLTWPPARHPCDAGTITTATPISAPLPARAGPNASGSGGLVRCCGRGGWGCGLGALGSPGRVVVAGGASWRGRGGLGGISFGMVQFSRHCRENYKRLKSRRLCCVWGDLRRRKSQSLGSCWGPLCFVAAPGNLDRGLVDHTMQLL